MRSFFLAVAAFSTVAAQVNVNRPVRELSCSAATASGTTYACSPPVDPGAYRAGAVYFFKADVANTGAATINFTAHGAKSIKKPQGGVTTNLVANDIQAGQWVTLIYDGSNMQMISQIGNVSGAGFVYTGVLSGIPATCTTGQIAFITDATAGQNIYECKPTNTWTQQLNSGGGGATSGLQQFDMSKTSASVASICSTCSSSTPGIIMNNGILGAAITAPATATLSGTSASGTLLFYLANGDIPTIAHNSAATVTPSAGWTVATGVAAVPPDAVATFWEVTFTANVIDTIAPLTMDKRGVHNVMTPGSGIAKSRDGATGNETLSTDPTTVPRYTHQAGAPTSTCTAGRDLNLDDTAHAFYDCTQTNTWTARGGGATSTQTKSFIDVPYTALLSVPSAGQASGVVYCVDFNLAAPQTATTVYTFVNGVVAADIYGMAIYDANGNRLTGATSTGSSTASSAITATALGGGSIVLTPGTLGRFSLCYTSNAGTGFTLYSPGADLNNFNVQPAGAGAVWFSAANSATFASPTITWPATLGTKTALSGFTPVARIVP